MIMTDNLSNKIAPLVIFSIEVPSTSKWCITCNGSQSHLQIYSGAGLSWTIHGIWLGCNQVSCLEPPLRPSAGLVWVRVGKRQAMAIMNRFEGCNPNESPVRSQAALNAVFNVFMFEYPVCSRGTELLGMDTHETVTVCILSIQQRFRICEMLMEVMDGWWMMVGFTMAKLLPNLRWALAANKRNKKTRGTSGDRCFTLIVVPREPWGNPLRMVDIHGGVQSRWWWGNSNSWLMGDTNGQHGSWLVIFGNQGWWWGIVTNNWLMNTWK